MSEDDFDVLETLASIASPTPHLDDRNVFDNRVTGSQVGEVGYYADEAILRRYYQLKFTYLTDKLRRLSDPTSPARSIRLSDGLIAIWDNQRADEAKAYVLRRLYCPIPVVHSTWYNELPEFLEWTTELETLLSGRSTWELNKMLDTVFPICIEEEMQHTGRLELAGTSFEHSAGVSVSADALLFAICGGEALVALQDLAGVVATRLARNTVDLQDALSVLVSRIKERYHLRVCDYLSVTDRSGDPRLELLASSWDGEVEGVRRSEAAYSLGGGITGSVFLFSPSMPNRWVGTNILPFDPRQSPRHSSLFESVYGTTKAFMVFPVFDGHRLVGALRAIDPETALARDETEALQTGGRGTWPFKVRAELAHIATWLSSVLPILESALPGGSEESPLFEVSRYWPALLDWVPPRFFASVLADVSRICSMRSEHREVSCTIAICSRVARDAVGAREGSYPAVPTERMSGSLDRAADLFGRVLPGAGVFVCDIPEDNDSAMLPLQYSNVLATGCFSAAGVSVRFQSIRDLCIVEIDGRRRVGRIYESGRWLGDYYLNEKNGRWRLRVKSILWKEIRTRVPEACSSAVQDRFFWDLLVPYSYEGHGGLVVLSDTNPRELVAEPGFEVRESIIGMSLSLFSTIVSVDGGTWIDCSGEIRQAGMLFSSASADEDRDGGGARHQAAATILRSMSDAVIIAISSNRVITVLRAGHNPLSF